MIFRFLASLKLAVICLGTLSLTLAVATKFNSAYGMNAANDYIYQTRGFALLLAFLATNVFCAAAIRYPWAKRQTGFVITHIGLLVVIGGSWYASWTSDEGLLNLEEGSTSSQLVRGHKPMMYVKAIDPHTSKSLGEYKIPVSPGAFDWSPGDSQVVTKPEDPFQLAIKGYYAASIPREVVRANPVGRPMIQVRPTILPPGETIPRDAFADPIDRWFPVGNDRVGPSSKDLGPAQFKVYRADRAEVFDDFLNPPANPGIEGIARLHYEDRDGKTRQFDVRLDDASPGQPIPLPESDLTAQFVKVAHEPIPSKQEQDLFGAESLDVVLFKIKRGDGADVEHHGYAMLPDIPAVIPSRSPDKPSPAPLARINYYYPPVIDPQVNRRFGEIDLIADTSGRIGYRVFERGNPAKVRATGLIKPGETITAFGGNKLAPMTLAFTVEEYLQSARFETIAESVDLPPGERDNALPAVLAEMTVGGVTHEVWLRKSPDFEPNYKPLAFDDKLFDVAFDVDRLDLGFSLTLNDFDVVFDPGTTKAASYKSEVTLTDEKAGIKAEPRSIFMNHTLDHSGWRFFQTSYYPIKDKRTGRTTGEFGSILQVAKNPARNIIYAGCLIVVAGAFVQFYMRAGVFSDGGKLERERAAAKARRRLEAKSRGAAPAPQAQKTNQAAADDDPFEPL